VALGLVVLLGWTFEVGAIKSVLPGAATMKPNAALCLILAGLALVLACADDRRARRLAAIPAAAMAALALLSLAQDLIGFDAGIDQLLLPDDGRPVHTGRPGRMSPLSALALALVGGALLTRSRPWPSQAMALAALATAGVGVLGYAYGAEDLYRVP
jgi:hypothetical protein